MKGIRSGWFLTLLALCCGDIPSSAIAADAVVPKTGVFVLVDISATWLSKKNEAENGKVLTEVRDAVLDLLQKAETPAMVYVITIEADSVLKRPLCEALYRRTLIGARKGEFNRPEDLANYLDLCSKAILNKPQAQWTDIHGALDLVSRINRSNSFQHRYMFVVSDFKEERPIGGLPKVSLDRFRVALIYRILPEDSKNPKGLEERLAKWDVGLRKAGAHKVEEAVDKAKFAGSVVQRLLRNQ